MNKKLLKFTKLLVLQVTNYVVDNVYLPDALGECRLVRDDAPEQRHRAGVDLGVLGDGGEVLGGVYGVYDDGEECVDHGVMPCDVLAGLVSP